MAIVRPISIKLDSSASILAPLTLWWLAALAGKRWRSAAVQDSAPFPQRGIKLQKLACEREASLEAHINPL